MSLVLLLLGLIGGVVALPFVILARRRTATRGISPAEIVTYLILALATLITINSISSLLEIVMPGDGVLIAGAEDLALSLSTLIVAGVVAVALWIAMERSGDPARPARELYLALVIAVSMAVVAAGVVRLLVWAVGASDFEASALADILAFGAAWLIHERFRRKPEELDELRQLAGALIGLSLSASGVFVILHGSLDSIVNSGQVVAGGGGGIWEQIRIGVVLLVVGVPFLSWFWLRGLADRPGPWRNVYAVFVSVTSWFTGFTSSALVISLLAQWAAGLNEQRLARHFASIPVSGALLIVAGIAYWHHRAVLGMQRDTAIRFMEYFFSAVGLIAGAGSVVTLASILGDNLFGTGSVIDRDSRLAVNALVVLIISGVVVGRYWVRAMRLSEDPEERMSAPRRATILILRVGFFLVGAGALIAVLYVLLRAALEGDASRLSDDLTVSVPLVIVSGLMVWHLTEQRTKTAPGTPDQPVPVAGPVKVGTVTVVATDPGPLPTMIHGMRFLRRGDGIGIVDQQEAEEIVSALASVTTSAAIVMVNGEGHTIVPVN